MGARFDTRYIVFLLIFNPLNIALQREGDSPPRITRRGGSLRIQFLSLGDMRLGEVGAPPPLNTQSGGCRRIRTSFEARPDLRLPESGQDKASIRAKG